MNRNIVEGKWKQFRGEIQSRWGKLTDDDLDEINGDMTKLAGKLQETYGLTQQDVEKQLRDIEKSRNAA